MLRSVATCCYAIVRSQFTQVHDDLRALLALPCRLGGLGLVNPTSTADQEYSASRTSSLTHDDRYTYDTLADQLSSVVEVKKMKRDHQSSSSSQLKASLPPDLQRAMDLSMERALQTGLQCCLDEFGFTLHKEMLLPFVMAGPYTKFLTHAPVAQHSVWSMLYPVQKVDNPRYVIMT